MKSNGDQGDQPIVQSGEDRRLSDELADIDLNDPELAQAASKIQKQFRGFKKAGPTPKEEAASDAPSGAAVDGTGILKESENDELADIDLTDPELEKAAMKIQSTFKGFKTRKTLD